MAFQNLERQITVILYRLKRQWPLKVVFFQFDSQTNNVDTGDIVRNYNTFTVRRAIVLPDRIDRSFIYDLTFIAANNNFVGGGLFDRHRRTLILDAKDLPKDFEPTMDDHLQFDSKRYEILAFDVLIKRKGFLLQVQEIENSTLV